MESIKFTGNASVTHVCDVDGLELDKFTAATREALGVPRPRKRISGGFSSQKRWMP